MHDKKPRAIKVNRDDDLRENLEKYRQMAIDLGCTDAKIVPAEKVYVDRRVRIKCTIPKCPAYGGCAHCPPHNLDTNVFKELVSEYRYGILMKINVDPELMLGGDSLETDEQGNILMTKKMKKLLKFYRTISDVASKIEAQAFYDGHHLAVGFAAGSCRGHYCNFKECQVLQGNPCLFAGRARPSMEGSSIDAYRMAAEAGWEMYPIGTDCNPNNVPHGTLLGLVLVD